MVISIWKLLTKKRKMQFFLILLLMILTSFLEVISISAVVPFLGVLNDPARAFEYNYVSQLAFIFDIEKPDDLLLPLTIMFAFATIIAAISRILLLYFSTRLSFSTGADFSIEIYKRTLYQDYSFHTSQNSSEIINGIITKTNTVISKVLVPALNFITAVIMIVSILSILILINTSVALTSIVILGGAYVLIGFFTKQSLVHNSNIIAGQSDKMIKSLQEGLGGIREVLIDGSQEYYCNLYRGADLAFRRASGGNVFISSCPRYVMEGAGIVFIAGMAYLLSLQGGISVAIPVLGALAIGAQKLLPALQQAYASYTLIKGAYASLNDVISLLSRPIDDNLIHQNVPPLVFEDSIQFCDVSFQYSPNHPLILKDVNLTVRRGEKIGIIGATGSGKSTFIDLLMCLLKPSAGAIFVDGIEVKNQFVKSWQMQIAHVPQAIYLSDGSIKENIAFGKSKDNIILQDVRSAARNALISGAIDKMSDAYETRVGERGIQLSGGQRQRIGIARALYKNKNVFVFDEATSALDPDTEQHIMKKIDELSDAKTMFIVAHRWTTLRGCDRIIKVEDDGGISELKYEELAASN